MPESFILAICTVYFVSNVWKMISVLEKYLWNHGMKLVFRSPGRRLIPGHSASNHIDQSDPNEGGAQGQCNMTAAIWNENIYIKGWKSLRSGQKDERHCHKVPSTKLRTLWLISGFCGFRGVNLRCSIAWGRRRVHCSLQWAWHYSRRCTKPRIKIKSQFKETI